MEEYAEEEEPRLKPGRKPSKASRLKALEKDILEQTLVVKQAKQHLQRLIEEYNQLKTT